MNTGLVFDDAVKRSRAGGGAGVKALEPKWALSGPSHTGIDS